MADASVVCLPELCITGYGCEDAFLASGVHETSLEILAEILPETRGMIVSLGLPLYHCGAVFDAACLAVNGKLLGFVAKQNLAGDGLHYEPRWFKRWPDDVRAEFEWNGVRYPLGDLMFDVGGVRFGFEICEDAWVAERPGSSLARRGCDVLLNPSASHFAFGKHEIRKRFVLEGSRAFSVGYVYANLLGNEAGRAIYDGDAMIASCGELLAEGPRFSFADQLVTTGLLDVQTIRMNRARTFSFRPLIENATHEVVSTPFDYPAIDSDDAQARPSSDANRVSKYEEFVRIESLALFDYMRKSRSNGFVVSLSGGADSATVSVLVAKMVGFALRELGRDGLLAKLSHIRELSTATEERSLVERLLVTAYQATRNSGSITREAARNVASGIGAKFLELDVDGVAQNYIGMISRAIGRDLQWQTDDIALQNIQARVRSPSIWMLANLTGALLLSTSNRSEAAVGYATMDGDTSGGLAPIAGIDKAFIREWLMWMEKDGPSDSSPIPELAAVNEQAPTAELRPPSSKQTDEDDLMPYPILDAIERAAIRDKKMPLECLLTIGPVFNQFSQVQLAAWVERFFKLWCRNQWKRERYAPSFHVDDENLDPKTWCRFPILSGGFERELASMWKHVKR